MWMRRYALLLAMLAGFGLTVPAFAQTSPTPPAAAKGMTKKDEKKPEAKAKKSAEGKKDKDATGRAHGMQQGEKKGMDHGQKKGMDKMPKGQDKKS
jgi:uncharacterized protein involved in copper resistance